MRIFITIFALTFLGFSPQVAGAHPPAKDGGAFYSLVCPRGYSLQTKRHRTHSGTMPMARCVQERKKKSKTSCPLRERLSIDHGSGGQDRCKKGRGPKQKTSSPKCGQGYHLVVAASGRDHCLKVNSTYRKPSFRPHR